MKKDAEAQERLRNAITDAIHVALKEQIAISRMEEFFSPQIVDLTIGTTEDDISVRLHNLTSVLGGPPKTIITESNRPLPKYDSYSVAAIDELPSAFHRSRSAVQRAHMFFVVLGAVEAIPGVIEAAFETAGATGVFLPRIETVFWESAEMAFIRLSSFWDRAGQLMDFVFFGIRQYERDGFSSVMDRIHNNHVAMLPRLGELKAWKNLRSFQNSEKETGLKWLLRRRNLLIHSLHLRPVEEKSERDAIYMSAYNHLDARTKEKLRPGKPQVEVERLNQQLRAAATGFRDVLSVCEAWKE